MSDSLNASTAPKKAHLDIPHLQIPRPVFQRETTFSPSQWRDYTPKTSHGFIAMHTSTPEDLHQNRNTAKAPSAKDYFSVPKKRQMLSPNPTQYEAHGFLPLCSVAAVEEKASDYFAVAEHTTGNSKSDVKGASSGSSNLVKNSRCHRTPQCEGYLRTNHVSLREPAHPMGSPLSDRDAASEQEGEQDTRKRPVIGMRGGSGEELCDEEDETAGRTSTEDVCAPRQYQQAVHTHTSIAVSPTDVAQRDYTEERNPISVLNRDFEQMLRAITAVCNRASETIVANDAPVNTENELNDTTERGDTKTESQLPTDQSDAQSDDDSVQSEIRKIFSDMTAHDVSSIVNVKEANVPDVPRPAKILPMARRKAKKTWKGLAPLEGDSGRLFNIMQRTDNRKLIALNSGFTVDIVNANTKKPYVRKVPLRMLWHFCGIFALDRFAPEQDERPDMLKIPVEEADKSGMARVVRYMRRASKVASVRPSGELRIPPSLTAGIETIRACRVFGLQADAERLEDVIIEEWMGNEAWYMTDEHVELIWDGYNGSLRDTVFGDAIVWFVLTEVQDKSHPLAEEIKWMLDQEEYETLKARVLSEVQKKKWRLEDRDHFLGRCSWEREEETRKEEERAGHRSQGHQERPDAGLWNRIGVLPDVPIAAAPDASDSSERSEMRRAGTDTPLPNSLSPY